jgi:hypothetical protein
LRGTFHLSLTVLVHYRSSRVFSLGEWSPRFPTQFHVLGGTQVPRRSFGLFGYRTITVSGGASQPLRLKPKFVTAREYCRFSAWSYNTACTNPAGHVYRSVWADPRSFATTRGIISIPRGTKMFQFPRLPPTRLYIQREVPGHYSRWVAPFGNPRLRQLAANRGISQQCHVLHRPSTPRHPPRALTSLRRTQNKSLGPPPSA